MDFKNDEFVVIREGKRRSKFFFADPSVIVAPPEKEISLPSEDVCFIMKAEDLQQLKKAASVYQVPDISVIGENGVIKLVARDKKFVFNFKEENLKIVPGNYDVVVSEKLLSRFVNQNQDVTYYIALEPDSTFG